MDELILEKMGGFAGFGGAKSALRSDGVCAVEKLSAAEKQLIEEFFQQSLPQTAAVADGFRYRIVWPSRFGDRSVDVPESLVPDEIKASVKDRLR
ncbi:hypothetical protein GOZ89_05105 [Agrobacterium vitis]|uniref:Uncharacterized protein n=1 Tax=Agrobacterium vitis TaxID=373 RepID=A0A368NWN2_AGRVI|nr:protealysin inhibitor emfourin [Agrobacterium vitis]KAA3519524.1 hypothetical protein DXM22_01050 [Agrobacterium vitis]KAA3532265.1 hypothetical protein DXT89_02670 [Agrobacterium vitis]MCF1451141.1 hypothetical protein [Agrobacterium vitis]MCF1475654.1 hypothetical protein [Agrobacterium vitis]MUZ95113.1 hypothetical protein [Agrobacterium vitis]